VVIYSYIEALEGFPVLFQGQYGDFETAWYNKVMVTIISTAIVNIVAFPLGAALPNIAAAASRFVFGCCAPSQKKLNEIYTPAEFSLAKRYGQMLCGLFYSIIFLCAAPPLAPAAAVLFFAMYLTDKWLLLKFSKRPPMYDHKLNAFFLKTAPYAAWTHLALACWAFGYYEIPSFIVDPGGLAGKVGVDASAVTSATGDGGDVDLSGKPAQFDFMARLVRANALVPFVMFLIVTVALFFAGLVENIASVFGNACVGEEKVDEVPPFSDLIFAGDSRYDEPTKEGELNNKLSGLRSYRLEDNPEYMKLFPEVLSADGTGGTRERPATPANKAPKAQNMV
jgi:DNA-directed RNA polymerase II subunit RPB7